MVTMAQVNLFPTFDKWTVNNGSGNDVSDSLVVSGDGYSCSFSVASEDSYLRLRIQDNDIIALRGRKLVLHLDNFSSSDNKPWLRIRAYSDTTNNIYESFNLYYEDDDVPGVLRNFPIDYEFVVPEDCVRLDIRFQHDYAAEGIDPPALLTISNASLTEYAEEKEPEFINFHKVLEENLPASVTPGTQHVYFTAKDSEVKLYVATNEGTLISTPDVKGQINTHNSSETAHEGIRRAIAATIPTSQKGTANGVAELDANSKVPTSQLPSYVDDVLEYSAKSSFPTTGETGKIYVDTSTNKTYRWSGSAYTEISASLALGETSSTAYRGDRGKIAYDHSQSKHITSSDVSSAVGSAIDNFANSLGDLAWQDSIGLGTGTTAGIIKLSDSTSSTSDASAGIAATPTAVKAAYDLATSANSAASSANSTANNAYSMASLASSDIASLEGRLGSLAYRNSLSYSDVGAAPSSHAHGNINSTGTITSTEVTTATGVLVYDSSSKIQRATAAQARSIIGAGTSNLTIGTSSTTAAAGNHTHSGYVPTNRTVNGKALSSNISLTYSDVGADASGAASGVQTNLNSHTTNKSNPHGVTAAQVGALSTGGGTLTGALGINGKVTQGSPSSDSTVTNMNRFQADLFVEGNGSAPNVPKAAGFYLGKSASDGNRHMDIVSGETYSYIDFNKAGNNLDYDVRLLINVESGDSLFMWDSTKAAKTLNVMGTLLQNGVGVATHNDLNAKAPAYQYSATDPGAGSTLTTGTLYLVYE